MKTYDIELAGNITQTPLIQDDHGANGAVVQMQVDVNATGFGAALYMAADGNFEEATASGTSTMPCTALALETGTGNKEVLLVGFVRDDSWDWTKRDPLFVSTVAGTLTQTGPTGSGDQVQIVGYATHADRIYFNPNIMVGEVE